MYDSMTSLSIAPIAVAFLFVIGSFLTLASGHVFAQDLAPSAIVELTTSSGRTFRGRISPKSDFHTVHLTTSRGSIELSRPISWTAIRHLTINELPASFEKLATLITTVQNAQGQPETPANVITLGPPSTPRENEVEIEQLEAGPTTAPVSSISSWATFKSWDSDPIVDGLEVTFTPEDSQGLPTAARGHLEAELYAFQKSSFSSVPHGHGARFVKIGSWRIPLDQTFPRYDSRVARLPYQSISPATDGSVSPLGTLVIKLVIPGQGTFSASLEDVRLRPYSSVRDANVLRGNPRYYGAENPRYVPYYTP
ncbi:hypothetical protein C5Y96_25790 [Blastopirellula marina]|uniref:Uncharacterized protein n=1 Tax=Blastopirellula marina TaxID=124 RepID=A0A2S8F067_9BACT|nr:MULTISPECIES: hypothetical protein [Pirellulaceae]PQO25314.1 hypothetical protein C5Y96_25790 [Blastopirellula marina]RCS41747.1 hypothetical protein DTL36_25840 [Bremerella cremea]